MEISGPYPLCPKCGEGALVPVEITTGPGDEKGERVTSIRWLCTKCGHSVH